MKSYVFEDPDITVGLKGVKYFTSIEFAAILHTGIPAKEGWWDSLSNRQTRVEYAKRVVSADFTDERS